MPFTAGSECTLVVDGQIVGTGRITNISQERQPVYGMNPREPVGFTQGTTTVTIDGLSLSPGREYSWGSVQSINYTGSVEDLRSHFDSIMRDQDILRNALPPTPKPIPKEPKSRLEWLTGEDVFG